MPLEDDDDDDDVGAGTTVLLSSSMLNTDQGVLNGTQYSCCCRGLVVGNYCHDALFLDGRLQAEALGGAVSFISNVFNAIPPPFPIPLSYLSKVGPDFRYYRSPHLPPPHSPSPSSPTTLFHAYFSSSHNPQQYGRDDRLLRRVAACDQILPSDLVDGPFDFGLAVAVAGEISPGTLDRMIDICRFVFVDAQALLRTFDADDGTVRLVPLHQTRFFHLLPRIRFLKASADEAPFLHVQEIRRSCCVLVTNGSEGCTIYCKDGELHIPAFPTQEVDPTGAGDSFFAGFVAGLMMYGLSVADAALLGNFFGSLAVRQIGLPKFSPPLLQAIKDEVCRKTSERGKEFRCCSRRWEDVINLETTKEHEEFMRFLATESDKLCA